ncbi:unnamed protein product [Closterium sp. Naga37s-1]|nr:unnamed protein product [Closterium sp. Naga37s-1]
MDSEVHGLVPSHFCVLRNENSLSFLLPPHSKEYGNLKGAGADFDCLHDTPCATTVAVWAVGGRSFTFPPNVAYPIGPGYFTKFVLQVEMDACYDFCASYDNETLGLNPNSPTLSKFYVCGPNFIPTYQPCKFSFGSNTPKKVVNGCPAENQASRADIPSDTISAPLSANAPPAPAAQNLSSRADIPSDTIYF